MKDLATKEQFVELRSQGLSFASIADQIGVSKATLINWSKEMQDSIGNLRQLHLDSIREKHRLGVERRMEIFGTQMNAIEQEIATRDLTELPTARLYDILIKLTKEVQQLESPLQFAGTESSLSEDMFAMRVQWEA